MYKKLCNIFIICLSVLLCSFIFTACGDKTDKFTGLVYVYEKCEALTNADAKEKQQIEAQFKKDMRNVYLEFKANQKFTSYFYGSTDNGNYEIKNSTLVLYDGNSKNTFLEFAIEENSLILIGQASDGTNVKITFISTEDGGQLPEETDYYVSLEFGDGISGSYNSDEEREQLEKFTFVKLPNNYADFGFTKQEYSFYELRDCSNFVKNDITEDATISLEVYSLTEPVDWANGLNIYTSISSGSAIETIKYEITEDKRCWKLDYDVFENVFILVGLERVENVELKLNDYDTDYELIAQNSLFNVIHKNEVLDYTNCIEFEDFDMSKNAETRLMLKLRFNNKQILDSIKSELYFKVYGSQVITLRHEVQGLVVFIYIDKMPYEYKLNDYKYMYTLNIKTNLLSLLLENNYAYKIGYKTVTFNNEELESNMVDIGISNNDAGAYIAHYMDGPYIYRCFMADSTTMLWLSLTEKYNITSVKINGNEVHYSNITVNGDGYWIFYWIEGISWEELSSATIIEIEGELDTTN